MLKLNLSLDTLKHVKHIFELHGDCSTECAGYNYICNSIVDIEKKQKNDDFDLGSEEAELMIEFLIEHKT